MPFGGRVRVGVAVADNPLGPFIKQDVQIFDHPEARFPTDDNFIWFSQGRFYAIVKDQAGHLYKSPEPKCLVLFESDDGLRWSLSSPALVSRFEIRWDDGAVTGPLRRLDQPQVWLENGRPAVLFLAVKQRDDADHGDLSYNIHVPLK